jgi:hypothetical protein
MNSNASQFSQSSPSTPLEAAALKAVRSKRQKQLNMHHAPTIDEQLKYAKLFKMLASPVENNKTPSD